MRYTPIALTLSLFVAVSSSVIHSAPVQTTDPRALALMAAGREALAAGDAKRAADQFESALTLAPGSVEVLINLAAANRRMGLQGQALHYYRDALQSDPRNLAAIAGEGAALAEKGATEKANRNLARLKGLCGGDCAATRELAAAIARGPSARVVTAEAVTNKPEVTEN